MSRGRGDGRGDGRGRGRGRGGGGGVPPRGGGRGGRGGGQQHNWGEGRVLGEQPGEGFAQSGAGFRGRGGAGGRGRGGAIRGHALRASKQNAVEFDYGTPSPSGSGQQTPARRGGDGDNNDDEDEDDIILETHRSYRHVIKPHLEDEGKPSPHIPAGAEHEAAGMSMMLPPSVSNLYARTPNNQFALERAQRAMQGQVAGLIPTGPKSAHVHRMYGTLDNVHNYQKSQQRQKTPLTFPLPVSTKEKTNEKSQKGKADRPLENSTGDPCIAGIPRSTPRRDAVDKSRFLRGGGTSSGLNIPLQFVKASGEWKDGAWIRASDGKETVTTDDLHEAQEQTGQPSDPFDRMAGAGLGYHGKKGGEKEGSLKGLAQDEVGVEANDPIEALLKAFPGSEEMQVDDADGEVDTFGVFPSSFRPTPEPASRKDEVQAPVEGEDAFFVDRVGQSVPVDKSYDDDDDDDEEILIAQTGPARGESQMVESDSEEERQLDEIIRRENAAKKEAVAEVDVEEKDSFFVDLTGEEGSSKGVATSVSYEHVQMAPLGEATSTEERGNVEASDETGDEHKISAAEKFAPKKAKKKGKKGSRARRTARVAREGDLDLDWGSDGPPVKFRQKADQDSFEHGSGIDQLSLDAVAVPQNGEEEETMLALALANSVDQQQPKATTKRSQKEAILADYMENAMGMDGDDDSDEEMATEKKGEKGIDEQTDMDTLLAFLNGMDGQRQGRAMTMEDIAIEQQMQEEDEWMTESEDGDETVDAAIQKEEKKLEADGGDTAGETDSDSSSEEEVTERQNGKRQESWSDSEDSDESDSEDDSDDDDEAFDRQFSWADADEDFIARLDKFAHANDAVLKGRDRKARNKLFKMIESGNFGDFDEEDLLMDDEDDPVFGSAAREPVRGGKKAKKPFKSGDLWAEELQAQWEKDRSTKAVNKRKRAAERAAAAENPFHATQIKKGTKKMAKKAARAERRAARRSDGRPQRGFNEDDDDDDDEDGRDSGPLARHATNLVELDKQIQLFLRDAGKTTLSLAPMDKRARAQVHLLANCYNLISKSKGNGNKRFPTLIKNQRSGLNVNVRKINSILRGASGSFGSGGGGGGSGAGGFRFNKDRISGSAASHVPKNQEGAAVGFGAERIGVDNIGHRLLSMMGWSEGSGVGLTQGAADPIGATIKVTKGGLGF